MFCLGMFKKLFQKAAISLAYGLKNTENDLLGQKTTNSESNSIHQQKSTNELMKALLNAEVTEEVALLRDRMYYVSEEAKKLRVSTDNVIINNLGELEFEGGVVKVTKSNNFIDKPKVFEDDYQMFLAMETPLVVNGLLDTMNSVADKNILEKEESPLNLTYIGYPKYKLHKFINKVVLRKKGEDIILDFYFPLMYEKGDNVSSILSSEIKKAISNNIKPINLEFETVDFITDNAYGSDDLCEYKFEMNHLLTIQIYGPSYVVSYSVKPLIMGNKITDKYIKPELRQGYKEKRRKKDKVDIHFGDSLPTIV